MPIEIRFPFAVDPSGSIAVTSDPDRQVHQRVHSLVGTEPGERVMLTDYGIETRASLFEGVEDGLANILADTAREQMDLYEPGVLINDVRAVEAVPGSGEARIAIDYIRREAPTTPSELAQSTNVAIIGVGGSVDEVVRG